MRTMEAPRRRRLCVMLLLLVLYVCHSACRAVVPVFLGGRGGCGPRLHLYGGPLVKKFMTASGKNKDEFPASTEKKRRGMRTKEYQRNRRTYYILSWRWRSRSEPPPFLLSYCPSSFANRPSLGCLDGALAACLFILLHPVLPLPPHHQGCFFFFLFFFFFQFHTGARRYMELT